MEAKTNKRITRHSQKTNGRKKANKVISEIFGEEPEERKQEDIKIIKTKPRSLREVLNDSSTDSTDSEEEDKSLFYEQEEEEEALKEVKTYYLLYKEIDKKFNIIISKRKDYKQKKYFACISCDEDKDFIMEFENHFKYNVDNIKVPWNYNYSNYRIHNLSKDKIKQEMDKFINSLGIGYYLEYFSTVENWTGKD